MFVGSAGFDEWSGQVWGFHVAWSGNHTMLAERLSDGRRVVQTGELLHPGEVMLEPGDSYRTPVTVGVYSDVGLTRASQAFHRHLRARSSHPTSPRPVTLNTWEAVYFDHDADRLRSLAEAAAEVGVERFVLDDGWFGSRRDDTSGLGDWTVSSDVYPRGLEPLISHVVGLGMQFGIWVEPEMVNPDSDVLRANPTWALVTKGYDPVLQRNQLVLDLTNRDAFAHVLAQLDALLSEHEISFVKWDMNRDLVAASTAEGVAGTHRQTLAFYELLDQLRVRHPTVEFESCSAGGARIDFAVLERTDRVWASDCNDAIDRQSIQRGASMLIPPELMGAHIGPPRAHTTSRRQSLSFRATTALFGHLGIEWDITEIRGSSTFDQLSQAVAFYKQHRDFLHTGDVVRFDRQDASIAHGVYAADRSLAMVSVAQLESGAAIVLDPLLLPGLDPAGSYRLRVLSAIGSTQADRAPQRHPDPAWLAGEGLTLRGTQLANHGVTMPVLFPGWALLLEVRRIDNDWERP